MPLLLLLLLPKSAAAPSIGNNGFALHNVKLALFGVKDRDTGQTSALSEKHGSTAVIVFRV